MNTLLTVDGSDNSYEAVHALKYFARAEQLTLLHALDVPRPAYPMMLPEVAEELYKGLEQSMREDGERLLDRVQSLLPMHAGPSTKHLRIGSPAEVIVSGATHLFEEPGALEQVAEHALLWFQQHFRPAHKQRSHFDENLTRG